MGRANALISGGELGFLCEFLQFLDQDGPFGKPERQAWADIVIETKELHLTPEFAVIALLGLLQHLEVGVHVGLVLERRAVDALKLRISLVAFVVCAGDVGEFEGADPAGVRNMGAGAEIGKVAIAIQGYDLAVGDVLNDVQFESGGFGPFRKRSERAFPGKLQRLRPSRLQCARNDGSP